MSRAFGRLPLVLLSLSSVCNQGTILQLITTELHRTRDYSAPVDVRRVGQEVVLSRLSLDVPGLLFVTQYALFHDPPLVGECRWRRVA